MQVDAARAYPVVVESAAMMPCSSSSVPSPVRLGPICTLEVCQDMNITYTQMCRVVCLTAGCSDLDPAVKHSGRTVGTSRVQS